MLPLHRLTPLVFLWPHPYLDPHAVRDLDFEAWSQGFEWQQDDWNGLRDIAQPVADTIESMAGDCEDYALVAASWAATHDHDRVGLACCFEGLRPRHVIAYDAERTYSNGTITQEGVDEFQERSIYDRVICRRIS